MTAIEGTDASLPVEYYFEETSGNCNGVDSGWQTSPTYELNGLAPGTQYCYNVKMRDAHGNETAAPAPDACVTTTGTADTDPPTPDPAEFDIAPHAIGQNSMAMTALLGSDTNGPVEYYFEEISGHAGGDDSGWQINPEYTDTGLEIATSYTYTVRMRDQVCNETVASAPETACTLPDTIDIVEDGIVDVLDLAALCSRWLDDNCCLDALCGGCDLDASGTVDMGDFSILAAKWLELLGPSIITLEYSPTDDAYKEGTSYQNTTQLRVESGNRISYLKFNVVDIPNGYNVTSVTLQLTENGDDGNGTLQFSRASNNIWTETTISASNEPAPQDQVGSFVGNVAVGQTITVDMTPLVTGNGTYSLVVMMVSGNDIWFGSKEAAGKEPVLTIIVER